MATNVQFIQGSVFVSRIINNIQMSVEAISHDQMRMLYSDDVRNAAKHFAAVGKPVRMPYQQVGAVVTVDVIPFGDKGVVTYTHSRDGSVTRKDWVSGVLSDTKIALGQALADKVQAAADQAALPF